MIAAAKAAGFDKGLERDGPIGLIAPTDEAFVITLGNLGITAEELMAHPEVCDPMTLVYEEPFPMFLCTCRF